MLVGCIITYNDMPLIKECVESLNVDRLIVVDGRYKDFPGDNPYSTDGTLEYLYSKGAEVINAANLAEVDKRNIYLKDLKDGDTVINLDADEVLKGKFYIPSADFGIIDLIDGHSRHRQVRGSRVFKYREGMEYKLVHFTLYWQDRQVNNLKKVVNTQFSSEPLKGCYILHNWHKRSQLRRHYKSLYYKKLRMTEAGYPR